jgi:DNA-directed RNA polymerase subunit omega
MQTHLLEEASKIIPVPQILVNVISQRVRQLTQGSRPLVEVDLKWGHSDIALKEVIEGKISYELKAAVPTLESVVRLPKIAKRPTSEKAA